MRAPAQLLSSGADVLAAHAAHVGAGAKRPAAPGQDDGADGVVHGNLLEDIGETAAHLVVHGVLAFGTVERDGRDIAVKGIVNAHQASFPCTASINSAICSTGCSMRIDATSTITPSTAIEPRPCASASA